MNFMSSRAGVKTCLTKLRLETARLALSKVKEKIRLLRTQKLPNEHIGSVYI